MVMPLENYLALVYGQTGQSYTEEQIEVIRNFDKDMITLADPGTGKTHTVILGLIVAQQLYSIKGTSIVAMSFTNEATGELNVRYTDMCRKMGIFPSVKFQTIHSLSYRIILENHSLLKMSKFSTEKSNFDKIVRRTESIASDLKLELSGWDINRIASAIKTLNNKFYFSPESVSVQSCFKRARIDFETLSIIRKKLYNWNKSSGVIPEGELCLYALEILMNNPKVCEKYRNEFKMLVVDECQDMSLIQLTFLSMLSDKLIAVGDLKQQIFGYAGAYNEIKPAFSKLRDKAVVKDLTQSFRCANRIVDYAKKIIAPNNLGGENFKGTGREGLVEEREGFDYISMLDEYEADIKKNNGVYPYQLMFLARTNFSLVPIMETIFQRKLEARIPKYINALEVPIVEDLIALTNIAVYPDDRDGVVILNKIIKAFERYKSPADNPIYKIMTKKKCSIFETNYYDNNAPELGMLLNKLVEVREMNLTNCKASELFNHIWPLYYKIYLSKVEYRLEREYKFYLNLVAPMLKSKTFLKFKKDEIEKAAYFEVYRDRQAAISCLTMHSSKGKQADTVCLLDVDEGYYPKEKEVQNILKEECNFEAASLIRGERSLLFVAATRAKNRLIVTHNGVLARIMKGETKYKKLDEVYEKSFKSFDECSYFLNFVG